MLHSEIYSIWLMVNTDTFFLFSGQKRGKKWEKETTAQPNEKQNVCLALAQDPGK